MRYPASEKLEIIRLVEQSHLPVRRTLEKLGSRGLFSAIRATDDRRRDISAAATRPERWALRPASFAPGFRGLSEGFIDSKHWQPAAAGSRDRWCAQA